MSLAYGTLGVICEVAGGARHLFQVQVYDENCLCVGTRQCSRTEKIVFSVPGPSEYCVRVSSCERLGPLNPGGAQRWVTVQPGCSSLQYFLFHPPLFCKPVTVDFQLTDTHYTNLPIEKGVLLLWPSML